MKIYEHKITDTRILNLYHENGEIQIQECNNGEKYSDYRLIYSDDYCFSGYTDNNVTDELSFTFELDHPLYYPFLHFLKDDKEIKFSSDFRSEEYDDICYIQIMKDDKSIILKFVNKIPSECDMVEKFDFEIKNIMFDLRSKLDEQGTDIKERLNVFFKEAIVALTEEYHQISIDEYMHSKTKVLVR